MNPTNRPWWRPKRSWLQFRLRTLLILMALLAVWLGVHSERARRQERACHAVRQIDGLVWYNYQYGYDETSDALGLIYEQPELPVPGLLQDLLGVDYFTGVFAVALGGCDVTPEVLQHLADGTDLRQLDLVAVPLTDREMQQIGRMRSLGWLNLAETGITDRELAHLQPLTALRALALERNPVTDEGLAHLANLSRLERLSLEETGVTDAGLKHLKRLSRLRSLELDGLPITDAGLVHLQALTGLEVLELHETSVTDRGVEELQRALPNAKIEHLGPKY